MLSIKLTADRKTGAGVNFEKHYAAFFKGFAPYGMPLFMPETGETTQIVHIETPKTGKEADARVILVEGDDFLYTMSNHSVSGSIDTVRLVRLGDAYDEKTGDLVVNKAGIVTSATQMITISGLDIDNKVGVKGEVHEIVRGFMGGGLNGTSVDPEPLSDHVWAEGHRVTGSTGDDVYLGTKFADIINGKGGNDLLKGGNGADKIVGGPGADRLYGGNHDDRLVGGAGADKLIGGKGSDILSGGSGSDTFIFLTTGEIDDDRIDDFTGRDLIDLHRIDANIGRKGNQSFDFIGDGAYSDTAGELRAVTKADRVIVVGDTDGDGRSDFRLIVLGDDDLGAADFLL